MDHPAVKSADYGTMGESKSTGNGAGKEVAVEEKTSTDPNKIKYTVDAVEKKMKPLWGENHMNNYELLVQHFPEIPVNLAFSPKTETTTKETVLTCAIRAYEFKEIAKLVVDPKIDVNQPLGHDPYVTPFTLYRDLCLNSYGHERTLDLFLARGGNIDDFFGPPAEGHVRVIHQVVFKRGTMYSVQKLMKNPRFVECGPNQLIASITTMLRNNQKEFSDDEPFTHEVIRSFMVEIPPDRRVGDFLAVTASQNRVKTLETLFKFVNDGLNSPDHLSGNTPLCYAAKCNSLQVAEMLLERGAKVDFANRYAQTPLILAVRDNSLKMVELLMRHGASLNCRDACDRTPLTLARNFGTKQMVTLLEKSVLSEEKIEEMV